ncbi:MAG: GIY-YIG nuclease family protein [Candidatus Acidiferrales bacterium]
MLRCACGRAVLKMFSVYVLRSKATGLLYTGSTSNLARRFEQHNSGISVSTKHGRPWELVFREDYPTRAQAVRRERELKTGKGRDELSPVFSTARPI